MSNYDAIVIGAGHNGLTNAAYLAKAGLNVVVLEKNEYIGGAAVSRELHEGWKYSNCSYVCSMMRQALHRDLDLGRHGLLLVPYLGTVNFGDGDERLVFISRRRSCTPGAKASFAPRCRCNASFSDRPDPLFTTHSQDIAADTA